MPADQSQNTCHAIVDLWNTMAVIHGLSQVRAMPPARVATLKARIKEVGFECMREAICRIGSSDHCRGQNDRGWRADFDFLITASRLTRILEGRYDNRHPTYRNGATALAAEMAELSRLNGGAAERLEGPAGE